MEYATIAGNYYTITSKNGCSVTDSTGTLKESVESGKQLTVQAPSDKLIYDDEQAIVFKSNFKKALAALGLLGGGKKTIFRLSFIESFVPAYIPTKVFPTGNTKINYVAATNETKNSVWFFATADAEHTDNNANDFKVAYKQQNPAMYYFKFGDSETVLYSGTLPSGTILTIGLEAGLFTSNNARQEFTASFLNPSPELMLNGNLREDLDIHRKFYSCDIWENDKLIRSFVPAINTKGEPCLLDTITNRVFMPLTGSLIAGIGSVEDLFSLISKLPIRKATLTLSLPAEANAPEVAAALEDCRIQKGWEFIIHEYRSAEASTYTLRRVHSAIWCRKCQNERGAYVDSERTRWRIEHCAAIFGEQGTDPTAYGYEPFGSVEEAAMTWGLEPYIDPNAEDLLTKPE